MSLLRSATPGGASLVTWSRGVVLAVPVGEGFADLRDQLVVIDPSRRCDDDAVRRVAAAPVSGDRVSRHPGDGVSGAEDRRR